MKVEVELLVFGTYKCPDKEPEKFGIKEETPNTYLGQWVEAMLPNKAWNKLRYKLKKKENHGSLGNKEF